MRTAIVVCLVLFAGSASAADWSRYEDTRFGFTLEVPPDLGAGEATEAGRIYSSADATEVLTVDGGTVLPGTFNSEWEATQASYADAGWTVTYKAEPPNWTSFTGERDGQSLYVKMLPLCGGTKQFARFALEYPTADGAALAPTIERLAASLQRVSTGFSC